MRDIEPIIEKIRQTVYAHRLEEEGQYTRWTFAFPEGETKRVNEYGVADAANILYMTGDFKPDRAFRDGFVKTLKGLQHPDTGLYEEPTHFPTHTTAHCIAALELFDEKPDHPVKALEAQLSVPALYEYLDTLDWMKDPWHNSHKGAGIYVIQKLTGACTREWEDAYFQWLWDNEDPVTGLWRKGFVGNPESVPPFHHMAGTFHYMFNHEYASKKLRYPEKIIDTNLALYYDRKLTKRFGKECNFMEIDWIFCLTRASRQTPHRFQEIKDVLKEFAEGYFDYFDQADPKTDRSFDDLHQLFGACCAIVELYRALPGEYSVERPLKLVLDRRPFI